MEYCSECGYSGYYHDPSCNRTKKRSKCRSDSPINPKYSVKGSVKKSTRKQKSSRHKNPQTDCPCPINFIQGDFGNFSLLCGSEPFKIFDSDTPTEMFLTVSQSESNNDNDNLCELTVTVELDDGCEIVLTVPNPNTRSDIPEQSSAQFYSQIIRRITLECQGGLGTRCRGNWNPQIFLRGSNTNKNCDFPVFVQNPQFGGNLPGQGTSFSIPCGSERLEIFESGEPVEVIGRINLWNEDTCELEVTIELHDGCNLVFLIPNPNTSSTQTEVNAVFYHTKDTKRITIRCLTGAGSGCRGSYINNLVLRAGTN